METAETLQPVDLSDIESCWAVRRQMYYRIAYNIVHERFAAEDACQQAVLKACEARPRIRSIESLGSWLTRTVINESLLVLRRRKTEVKAMANLALEPVDEEIVCEQTERQQAVMMAIGKLPEPTRTIVVLRIINGMSGNQVKEIVGCSSAEVSRRMHYGMELLRHELTAWGKQ